MVDEFGQALPPEIVPGFSVVLDIVLQKFALLVPQDDTVYTHNVPELNPAEKFTVMFVPAPITEIPPVPLQT